jgi:DNA-binding NtrC family response regulator
MNNNDKPVVLFIDDELFLLNAYQRMFRKSKWLCLYSQTIAEAHQLMAQYPVQLILCDYYLMDGNAAEFFQGLDGRFNRIKRILLSGSSDTLKAPLFNTALVDVILHKPCTKDKLTSVIEHCLRADSNSLA